MVKVKNFHEGLEKDLSRLTAEIKERQRESTSEKLSEKEIVKHSLQSLAAVSAAKAAASSEEDSLANQKLPNYLQKGDPQAKTEVEKLVDLVFQQGLTKAVQEAKKSGPFIEDAFHDALVDKLLPELKKRGVLK